MVEKYEVDDANTDKQTIVELTAKVNELVTVVSAPRQPRSQQFTPGQHAEQMIMMVQRMRDFPLKAITDERTNPLTDAIGSALTGLRVALVAYKASL